MPDLVNSILCGPGERLDGETQAFMESRFGIRFDDVRIHADAEAAESARLLDSSAYTIGPHIVFDAGSYAPLTSQGRRLLAHELAHVIQQRGANSCASGQVVQRKPSSKRRRGAASSKKRSIIAIHAQPKKTEEALAYLAGESAPVPLTLRSNELDQGSYSLVRRDRGETKEFIEYVHEDGSSTGISWVTPSRSIDVAPQVQVVIQPGPFDFESFARAEFDSVPERIKSRLTRRGAQRLKTAEEYFGFAQFARALEQRGVTDAELILFQENAPRGFDPRRRFDWASNWMQAVDAVLGARGELERQAEANMTAFRELGSQLPALSEEQYESYKLSKIFSIPGLREAVDEDFTSLGTSVKTFESVRDAMLERFDTRLRLETTAVLDRFEGGLRLTRERLVRDEDALAKIAAIREAVTGSSVMDFRARKEQTASERDDASRDYGNALMMARHGWQTESLADAKRTLDAKKAAYDEARRNYLSALEEVSGIPVGSWRGFNVEQFYFGKSARRSAELLGDHIAEALSDVARARRELSKDKRTIYKADMMVRQTKEALVVQPGSLMDRLINDRVEEYSSAPWWERLLDILSLALIFVPGGAAITVVRLGVGVAQTVVTIENEALAETLHQAGTRAEGGSVTNVALSGLGTVGDAFDVVKVFRPGAAAIDVAEQAPKVVAQAPEAAATTGSASARMEASRVATEAGEALPHSTITSAAPRTEVPPTRAGVPEVETRSGATPPSSTQRGPGTPSSELPSEGGSRDPGHRGATAEGTGEAFHYEYHPKTREPTVERRRGGATKQSGTAAPGTPERPKAAASGGRATTLEDLPEALEEATEGTATASRSPGAPSELTESSARQLEEARAQAPPARPSPITERPESVAAAKQAGLPEEVYQSGTVFTRADFPEVLPNRPVPRAKPAPDVLPQTEELERGIAGRQPTTAPDPGDVQHTEFRADVELTARHIEGAGGRIEEIAINRTQRTGAAHDPRRVSRRTRPDVQLAVIDAQLNGRRIVIEYDRAPGTRAMKHARDVLSRDPDAIVIIKIIGFE